MIARLHQAAQRIRRLRPDGWHAAARARLVAGCACLLALGPGGASAADAVPDLERAVKAAFVFRFLSYVEWPPPAFASADTPIVIGVHGAPDIATELGRIVSARTVAQRPVVVRPIGERDSLAGLHVLFVGRAQSSRLPAIGRLAQQHSILVVSESEDGLPLGSMINLVVNEGRVKFEVYLDSAERSGLRISSRLLAVAQSVRSGGGG